MPGSAHIAVAVEDLDHHHIYFAAVMVPRVSSGLEYISVDVSRLLVPWQDAGTSIKAQVVSSFGRANGFNEKAGHVVTFHNACEFREGGVVMARLEVGIAAFAILQAASLGNEVRDAGG